MKGEGQDPEIIKDPLYLATDIPRRTSRPPSTSPRRFTHPIYARSTMPRHSSPPTRAHRNRPPRGGTRTTRTITGIDSLTNTGRHHSRLRSDSPNSLRLAQGLENIVLHKGNNEDFLTENQVFTFRPASKSRSPQPEPEPPQTFDESLEMKIPPSVDHSTCRLEPVNSRTIGTRTRRR